MERLRLGSRKSVLAQSQARWVADRLRARHKYLTVDVVYMTTSGDKSSADKTPAPPVPGGLKTLFTKEIEEALLENRIDVAVHSMKDLSVTMPVGLAIGAIPEREDPRDVWISKNNKSFAGLPEGARVGTGAVRRQSQLKHLNPSLVVIPMRGNVDTRLAQLKTGDLDGIVLAWAGLARLGREAEATEIIPADRMVPAVGQGGLCVQIRESDARAKSLVSGIDHAPSRDAILAERSFLKALGGDCQTPIGAYARLVKGKWFIDGLVASMDGKTILKETHSFQDNQAVAAGLELAKKLITLGADKILAYG